MIRRFQPSLVVITCALLLLIALLAGGSLWAAHLLNRQAAHAVAMQAMIERGKQIASHLADQPAVRVAGDDRGEWTQFSRLVQGLQVTEHGLQYVTVVKNGVTVFREQPQDPTGRLSAVTTPTASTGRTATVQLSRRLVRVGDRLLPVVTFGMQVHGIDGQPRAVEVGLSNDAVAREEKSAADAIRGMLHVALATIFVAFGVCSLLVAGLLFRERSREQLRRAEEHLAFSGVIANGIVHDFRNPMSAVRLDAQMLARAAARHGAAAPARLQELAGRICKTLDRMDKVFQEFLYLSKPSAETRERIALGPCVRECVEMLAPRFEQAGVRAEIEPADCALAIDGYPSAFRRALINILTNAEQFSKAGQAVIIRLTAAGDRARIDVLDNGPGVAKAARRKIFSMFYSTRPGGTGLGLFLARTAVERCGGTIEILDRPEGGACFRITMPLASPAPENDEAAARAAGAEQADKDEAAPPIMNTDPKETRT